ncbi:MAG: TIGR00303 family protein [Desulfurococcales archaeon]|nr:TIGR00303 family protein [Desulfurococcales archaeon]
MYSKIKCLSGCSKLGELIKFLSTGEVSLAVVLSSTKVSEVPGITLASLRSVITIGGESLSPMDLPTIEAEVALAGRPLTHNVLPISPVGAPSPAVIIGALCKMYGINLRLIAAGLKKKPKVQHMPLDIAPGGDIRKCEGVKNAKEVFKKASDLADAFSRYDCVIIGESIPGGTTTAAAFLEALGYRAVGGVSSTLPEAPKSIKESVISEALKCLEKREVGDVFDVLEVVGDPVIPSVAGLAAGLLGRGVRVILGGGTQMAAVLALLKEIGENISELSVVTTKWVAEDPSAGFAELIRGLAPDSIITYLSIDLSNSRHEGLRLYERGYVKEGFGLGAVLLTAYLRSGLDPEEYVVVIDNLYAKALSSWST